MVAALYYTQTIQAADVEVIEYCFVTSLLPEAPLPPDGPCC